MIRFDSIQFNSIQYFTTVVHHCAWYEHMQSL